MPSTLSLEVGIRARRIWYHDIEVEPGLSTRFPEDYDANPLLGAVDEGNQRLVGLFAKHIAGDLRDQYVLDVGCADGLFAFWAARQGASRVLGIERNRCNFERADWLRTATSATNVHFDWGGIERNCPDQQFDYVLCVSVLYHFVNPLGTLHLLRNRCEKRLILVTAIDLPDGNGAPMSRLDRYATGAHGVWSFNVPMVRQLLSTAGFDIVAEHFYDRSGGGQYVAICEPGQIDAHHIFAEKIDQEFPINVERRRTRLREVWSRLAAEAAGPVAIFGAGTHTPWLLEQVADIPGVEVACILDDRIPPTETVAGHHVQRPDTIDPSKLAAIVLSSWHQTESLGRRAKEVFTPETRIVSLDP